jgi:hypothetical protein
MSDARSTLDRLAQDFLDRSHRKETAFWESRMGIAERDAEYETAESELRDLISDASVLTELRGLAAGSLTDDERTAVEGWIAMYERNVVESPEARTLQGEILTQETRLHRARSAMDLGYVDPATGEHRSASSNVLATTLRAAEDPDLRKAAFEGLRSIEGVVLESGYPEVVRLRNRFARALGHSDYYAYKVQWAEGFSKEDLFEVLDDLEERTRGKANRELRNLTEEKGEEAILPWNLLFHTGGSIAEERDPYFRFEDAMDRWARTFTALGIRFRGATLTLDLLDRRGKYENGFMHAPVPAFVDHGTWRPATINFTANAVPGQVGSGHRAAKTLFHEGGHAAHFANITMNAPCFSHEFAPTSVAFAETQAMFCDHLLMDADWQTRYARDVTGSPMPFSLIEREIRMTQPFVAQTVRSMLAIVYAEKAIYELDDDDLTASTIREVVREAEDRLAQTPGGASRPVLSVPHLLSWEASAYYHGYVLALLAVAQTRRHFVRTYGHILDNPRIGADLATHFWARGNQRTFRDYVADLTGEPLSADAFVAEVTRSADDAVAEARRQVDGLSAIPEPPDEIDLDVRLGVVHGSEVIAPPGTSVSEVVERFRSWLEAAPASR